MIFYLKINISQDSYMQLDIYTNTCKYIFIILKNTERILIAPSVAQCGISPSMYFAQYVCWASCPRVPRQHNSVMDNYLQNSIRSSLASITYGKRNLKQLVSTCISLIVRYKLII